MIIATAWLGKPAAVAADHYSQVSLVRNGFDFGASGDLADSRHRDESWTQHRPTSSDSPHLLLDVAVAGFRTADTPTEPDHVLVTRILDRPAAGGAAQVHDVDRG